MINYIPVNGNPNVALRLQKAEKLRREEERETRAKVIITLLYAIGAIVLTVIITQAIITSTAKATVNRETGAIVMEIAGHNYEYYE